MTQGIAFAGWTVALIATLVAVIQRRSLAVRMEAVARACHELRGPLTAARLGLEWGARVEQLSPARLRAIDLELRRAALSLDDLARAPDRSAGARIGHRHMAVRVLEAIDVQELLSDSVEAWRASAEAAGAAVRMRWYGASAVVLGERLRLAQATGNLLANAIEHGRGPIEVRGYAERDSVRIEVVDCGPGLPAPVSDIARRGRGRRGGWPGRGRGLAIACAVAAVHGGRLAAAPSEHGARLVLELPIAGTPMSMPAIP